MVGLTTKSLFYSKGLFLTEFGLSPRASERYLQGQNFVRLVGVVADCPAQVQATVDTAVRCNATSGLLDAGHFRLVFGLVVGRHLDGLAVSADDAARVSGVGDEQLGAADESDDGRAAGVVAGLKSKESHHKEVLNASDA